MPPFIARMVLIVAVALVAATADGVIRGFEPPPKVESAAPPIPPRPAAATTPEEVPDATQEPAADPAPRPAAQAGDGNDSDAFTPAKLKELMDLGLVAVVDARAPHEFEEGHIPGAFHLEVSDFGQAQPDPVVELLIAETEANPDKYIVVYCGGGDCKSSHAVGSRLKQFALDNITVFEGGYPEWVDAGYEIETGPPWI